MRIPPSLLPPLLRGSCSFLLAILSLLLSFQAVLPQAHSLDPVLASYDIPPFASTNDSLRQNVCDRYKAYQNGSVALQGALNGFQLRPVFTVSEYFPYSNQTGIDPNNPGLVVEILDLLAARAGFSWRKSFAVLDTPLPDGKTFTDLLGFAVDTYDLAADWWDRSPGRLAAGTTFLEPWLDASIILIDKIEPAGRDLDDINLTNFLRPFHTDVWLLILGTVVLSGVVYQFIEYLQGEHEGRSTWEWFSDNFYLSAINFSQNFEFAPTSLGGRIFAIGMTLWALLITATYTANLASLLVVSKQPATIITSIEEAIRLRIPICTWAGTQTDEYIKLQYPNAIRKPQAEELQAFQALLAGECGLVAIERDSWLTLKGDGRYNPDCDMEWVGRTVQAFSAGFAVKADAGDKCTSLIRDVLNVHMLGLINEGVLDVLKDNFRQKLQAEFPTSCGAGSSAATTGSGAARRMLSWSASSAAGLNKRRELRAKGAAATGQHPPATGGSSSSGESSPIAPALTLRQMLGTFVLLWCFMGIAVLITATSTIYNYWSGHLESYKVIVTKKTEPSESAMAQSTSQLVSGQFSSCKSQLSIPDEEPEFDWADKYAQMTDKEKLIADAVFGRTVKTQTA